MVRRLQRAIDADPWRRVQEGHLTPLRSRGPFGPRAAEDHLTPCAALPLGSPTET